MSHWMLFRRAPVVHDAVCVLRETANEGQAMSKWSNHHRWRCVEVKTKQSQSFQDWAEARRGAVPPLQWRAWQVLPGNDSISHSLLAASFHVHSLIVPPTRSTVHLSVYPPHKVDPVWLHLEISPQTRWKQLQQVFIISARLFKWIHHVGNIKFQHKNKDITLTHTYVKWWP